MKEEKLNSISRIIIIFCIIIVIVIILIIIFNKLMIKRVIEYEKYKYYDEDYVAQYENKILKNYDEYKEFIGGQKLLLTEKDFEKSYYGILFFGNSCNSEFVGISEIEYVDPIRISVKMKEKNNGICNDKKIILIPLPKNKIKEQKEIIYTYISII